MNILKPKRVESPCNEKIKSFLRLMVNLNIKIKKNALNVLLFIKHKSVFLLLLKYKYIFLLSVIRAFTTILVDRTKIILCDYKSKYFYL